MVLACCCPCDIVNTIKVIVQLYKINFVCILSLTIFTRKDFVLVCQLAILHNNTNNV